MDEVPGLVYGRAISPDGPIDELVDTGIQRLVKDLDELPHAVLGYQLLEPPGNGPTLELQALPEHRVRKHCIISSLVLTVGCKFHCPYCPIPAYNQRQFRAKSGERVADEMQRIAGTYGIYNFFGADDNFFNDTSRTLDIVQALARQIGARKRPLCKIRWATEATIHDTLRIREHLPVVRQSGLTALWLGVEDLTASLVKKGQDEGQTVEAFRVLRENGIYPVPMLMHHDSQPLVTWKSNYGLLNQLRILRKAGAVYTQVLMLTPSPGSKWYDDSYTSGLAFRAVNGAPVEPYVVDGNYVVASRNPRPSLQQLKLLAGYTYFFNPLRLLLALVRSKSAVPFADAETRPPEESQGHSRWARLRRRIDLKARAHLLDAGIQIFGMYGLMHTYRRTLGWARRLFRAGIQRHTEVPASLIPMRSSAGGPASHALPGTAVSAQVQHGPEASEGLCLRKAA